MEIVNDRTGQDLGIYGLKPTFGRMSERPTIHSAARIAASVGRTRMWIHRSLRACRSCRAGGQTRRRVDAVRMKADAPGQDGVRRRIQRGELLLDAGFDIDRDQPLNGVLRRRVPVKIERNERQRCLIKNAGSWGLWSRAEPEKRRNHSGATTGLR